MRVNFTICLPLITPGIWLLACCVRRPQHREKKTNKKRSSSRNARHSLSHSEGTSSKLHKEKGKRKAGEDKLRSVTDDVANLSEKFDRMAMRIDGNLARTLDPRMARDELEEKMVYELERLRAENENVKRDISHLQHNRSSSDDRDPLSSQNRLKSSRPSSCFFCKQENAHPRGLRNCPNVRASLDKGLVKEQNNRLITRDGGRLPQSNENLRIMLERMESTNPLLKSVRSVSIGQVIPPGDEISEDDAPNAGMVYSAGAYMAETPMIMNADRSNRENAKDNRFNPIDKASRGQNRKERPNVKFNKPEVLVPAPPHQWGKSPIPSRPQEIPRASEKIPKLEEMTNVKPRQEAREKLETDTHP